MQRLDVTFPATSSDDALVPLEQLPTELLPVGRGRVEPKTSDRVYDSLLVAIRDLHLLPGARLSETELARQLGVSRTPVREAIIKLVDSGLLQVRPQVGTLVARIRLSDAEEARFVREHLEAAAVQIVSESPDRDVSVLREYLALQDAAQEIHDLDAFFAADEAMHQEIFRASGYPGAWQAVQRKKLQLDRMRRMSLPDPSTIRELINEHKLIVDAIEAGQANIASEHVRVHARRAMLKAPDLIAAYPDYFSTESDV
jgi:GntR family transcriptional regulator, rspAB operon transcriptional repressor